MSSLPLHQRRDPLFPAYPLFVVVLSRKRSLSQRVALEEIHAHFKPRWYLFHGSFKFKKDKKKKRRERDVPGRLWLFKSTRSAAGQAHKYIYIIRAHTHKSPGLWRCLHTTVNPLSPSLSVSPLDGPHNPSLPLAASKVRGRAFVATDLLIDWAEEVEDG